MIWRAFRCPEDVARQVLEDEARLDAMLEAKDTRSVDLDKAWHGLHWLLTGATAPTDELESSAIYGGEPVGEDLGNGPGRLIATGQVRRLSPRLAKMPLQSLRARADPVAMNKADVYPGGWVDADFDVVLAPAFRRLRVFYRAAAESDEAVIQLLL